MEMTKCRVIGFISALCFASSVALAHDKYTSRVVGGNDASITSVPWQVGLFGDPENIEESLQCGGTIYNATTIISAQHCRDAFGSTVYVLIGSNDLSASAFDADSAPSASGPRYHEISSWQGHPDYEDGTFNNDIAVLTLKTPIDFASCGSACEAIDIVTPEANDMLLSSGSRAVISGWGNTQAQSALENDPNNQTVYPTILQSAEVMMVDCENTAYAADEITENMVCAGVADFSIDACSGDSGGPLVVNNTDGVTRLLAGVVSFGNGCALTDFPGVYAKASRYTAWVEGIAGRSSAASSASSSNASSGSGSGSDSDASSSSGGGGSLGWLTLMGVALLVGFSARKQGAKK